MGKPSVWYYSDAKKFVQRYPQMRGRTSTYAKTCMTAVDSAIEKTMDLDNGELIMECVSMILFKGTHTAEGAAQKLYVSRRTVERWLSSFIKLVGKESGIFEE